MNPIEMSLKCPKNSKGGGMDLGNVNVGWLTKSYFAGPKGGCFVFQQARATTSRVSYRGACKDSGE